MRFGPEGGAANVPDSAQKCTVAAGCFWGVEHMYRKQFKDALYDARVGYIGGDTKSPSYRAVCTGRTGRKNTQNTSMGVAANVCPDAEALQISYDPDKVTYRQLIEFLYKMHDPTTANRQGPDVGSQYRSGIFFHNEEQEQIAKDITDKVQKEWWKNGKIATQILPAAEWWDAEDYHQKYLDVNPGGYECPSHFLRSFPPLSS